MGIIKRNDKLYSGSADTAVKVNFVDTIAQLGAGTVQTAIEKLKGLIGNVPSGKTIEGQISELNAKFDYQVLSLATAVGYSYSLGSPLRKMGNLVTLCFEIIGDLSPTAGEFKTVAYIPEGFRPSDALYCLAITPTGDHLGIKISPNGEVGYYNYTGGNPNWFDLTATYIATN